ncbi:MAG TPA: HNH endonuclease signature motif containing protein [Candidatus Hydrogenedentes bacterium]|nr:HNH endonuclease signature motif containing protein [Candidatus Hydrogenedentota bacterium]
MRFCAHPGCGEFVRGGLCANHQAERDERDRRARASSDADRGNASDRGYDGTWQRARSIYLRNHPVCERCEQMGRVKTAALVHHIVPISEGGARLDPRNLASLCRDCHNEVHAGDVWRRT